MENMTNDIAPVSMMAAFEDTNLTCFCSIPGDDSYEKKVKIYNAMSGADAKIGDMINKEIRVVDVVAHPVQLTDDDTGEIIDSVRTVLIDEDGKRYEAVSIGILNALQKIFTVFGKPHWDEPITMRVKQVNTRNGANKVNTLELV